MGDQSRFERPPGPDRHSRRARIFVLGLDNPQPHHGLRESAGESGVSGLSGAGRSGATAWARQPESKKKWPQLGGCAGGPVPRTGLVPRHRGFDWLDVSYQDRQVFGRNEDLDAARHAGLASDQTCTLKG